MMKMTPRPRMRTARGAEKKVRESITSASEEVGQFLLTWKQTSSGQSDDQRRHEQLVGLRKRKKQGSGSLQAAFK
jgi:hypothetical protein